MRKKRILSFICRTIIPFAVILGSTVGQLALVQSTFGQFIPVQPNIRLNGAQPPPVAGLFPRNREFSRILGRAKDAIEKQQYREAVALLQLILDDVEDGSTAYVAKSADEESTDGVNIGLRSHAYSLLAALPKEGRQAYELMSGQTARDALSKGLETGDVPAIENVARRYLLTKAGREAGLMLARLHMDRNEFVEAALRYSRLNQYYAVDAEVELRTALCWAKAKLPTDAITILNRLRERGGPIRIGQRQVELFSSDDDPVAWLESVLQTGVDGLPGDPAEWLRPYGNQSQNAPGAPISTYGDKLWSASIFGLVDVPSVVSEKLDYFKSLYSGLIKRQYSERIPSRRPLVVGDVAVFRAFGKLQAIHLETGELEWESVTLDPTVANIVRYGNDRTEGRNSRQPAPRPSASSIVGITSMWSDLTNGTLSSDGRHVYSIEEATAVASQLRQRQQTTAFNILRAYDVESGKTVWDIGGKLVDNGPTLAGHFFLGPPLILGDRLYVLTEFREQIMLVALHEEQDGENRWSVRSDWSVVIANSIVSIGRSSTRRASGISPTFSDGKLICPTSAGAYVAVDIVDRMPVWGYQYVSDVADGMIVRGVTRPTSRWFDSTPRVTGEHVLLTPNDFDELHCIDSASGKRLWKKQQSDRRYIAIANPNRIVIVATNRVEAIHTQTGQVLWDSWLSGETIAGFGVAEGDRYHIPLVSGKIATMDVTNGRLLSVAGNIVPGNLVSTSRSMLSQSPLALTAYPSQTLSARQLANANDSDVETLVARAVFELQQGDVDQSLVELRQAIASEADVTNARALLRNTLLAGLRVKDAQVTASRLEELEALLKDDDSEEAKKVIWQFASLKTDRLLAEKEYGQVIEQVANATAESMSSMRQADSKRHVRFDRWIYATIRKAFKQANSTEIAEVREIAESQLEQLATAVAKEREEPADGDNNVGPLTNRVSAAPALSMNPLAPMAEQRLATMTAALSGIEIADQMQREWMKTLSPEIHPLRLESILRHQLRDSKTKGSATLQLLLLYSKQNRYDLVEPLLAEVETQYATATIETKDGVKTGQQLVDSIQANETATNELQAIRKGWSERELAVRQGERRVRVRGLGRSVYIPFAGDSGVFSGWSFRWDSAKRNLIAVDSLGRTRWLTNIRLAGAGSSFEVGSASIRSAGHLLLVSHTKGLFAVDGFGIHETELWSRLIRQASPLASQVVSLNSNGLLYATPTELVFVDPLTGEMLWGRSEQNTVASRCVSDGDYALIPSLDGRSARVYNLLDGEVQDVTLTNSLPPDRFVAFQSLVRRGGTSTMESTDPALGTVDSNVLSTTQSPDGLVVSSTNPIKDELSWQIELNPGSVVSGLVDRHFAVIDKQTEKSEKQYEVRIHHGATGDTILKTSVDVPNDPSHCGLLVSPSHYFVIVNHGDMQWSRRRLPVNFRKLYAINGNVFAFDRRTGKLLWQKEVVEKFLARDHSSAVPLLSLFYQVESGGANSIFRRYNYGLSILDARSGEDLFVSDNIGRSLGVAQLGAEHPAGIVSVQVMSTTIMLGPDKIINRVVTPEVGLPEDGGSKPAPSPIPTPSRKPRSKPNSESTPPGIGEPDAKPPSGPAPKQ